ncbi:DNA polymerase III subunit gamma/tau [Herbiconiux sp. KACC 21604]|uniref:DNA polymerase III subunit gamma/tau n=1 Tax=unclassified Herbiconiux TaxID=2618217 RepID=UPI00149267E6|nr:DNA polymerase III subunit gamma/tau [Herbiconiux sp. SALV-R1]QJU54291.1 DNA polymerase III subunit gamma/tau [Herbiconiux sp. SALV-R1]WPO85359.1 DNA polymerase III subunit gamma/tau [Herbiconiux sp. KACC 21604]
MSDPRDDDEEGLGWAGDDDPTLTPVGVPARRPAAGSAAGATAGGAEAAAPRKTVLDEAEEAEDRAAESELAAAEAESAQLNSAALIGYGVIGGVYLLFTIGWIVSFARYQQPIDVDFTVLSHRIAQALAVAAVPLWFVATLLLTQRKDVRWTFLWLVVGVLVLVPWPFLMGV